MNVARAQFLKTVGVEKIDGLSEGWGAHLMDRMAGQRESLTRILEERSGVSAVQKNLSPHVLRGSVLARSDLAEHVARLTFGQLRFPKKLYREVLGTNAAEPIGMHLLFATNGTISEALGLERSAFAQNEIQNLDEVVLGFLPEELLIASWVLCALDCPMDVCLTDKLSDPEVVAELMAGDSKPFALVEDNQKLVDGYSNVPPYTVALHEAYHILQANRFLLNSQRVQLSRLAKILQLLKPKYGRKKIYKSFERVFLDGDFPDTRGALGVDQFWQKVATRLRDIYVAHLFSENTGKISIVDKGDSASARFVWDFYSQLIQSLSGYPIFAEFLSLYRGEFFYEIQRS